MSNNETQNNSMDVRERERQRIATQVEEFLRNGGKITCLESHLAAPAEHVPRRAMINEIGIF